MQYLQTQRQNKAKKYVFVQYMDTQILDSNTCNISLFRISLRKNDGRSLTSVAVDPASKHFRGV